MISCTNTSFHHQLTHTTYFLPTTTTHTSTHHEMPRSHDRHTRPDAQCFRLEVRENWVWVRENRVWVREDRVWVGEDLREVRG
jgi:hypothetical protein